MNCTELALKLIKNYTQEHNRVRRAKNKQYRITTNPEYQAEMVKNGFSGRIKYGQVSDGPLRKYDKNSLREYFRDGDGVAMTDTRLVGYVSEAVKRRDLKVIERRIANFPSSVTLEYFEGTRRLYYALKAKPIFVELGKMWQEYVDAFCDARDAYEARWEARCAIKAFNKMGTGIQIKFGNCTSGKGSMDYPKYVIIDGDKIPLRQFLNNAEFEVAILSAPSDSLPNEQPKRLNAFSVCSFREGAYKCD